MHKKLLKKFSVHPCTLLLVSLFCTPCLVAHHEAIFGPQSTALISRKRFVSAQYYLSNEGRSPTAQTHSHIGVLSVGTSVGKQWSVAATLPLEAERGAAEDIATGMQDAVVALRYYPELGSDQWAIGVLTLEPTTGNLEHRAVGVGGGLAYGVEKGHWSVIAYGLGRTESSLDKGEKRGDRYFIGTGLAYETRGLPFSPQLGISWERTTRHRQGGFVVDGSDSSVLMLHPTLIQGFKEEAIQLFFVLSVPVAQRSGNEGWQGSRAATGILWSF